MRGLRTGKGPERLWNLNPWRYSTVDQQSLEACCNWPCFNRGLKKKEFKVSLPTSIILCLVTNNDLFIVSYTSAKLFGKRIHIGCELWLPGSLLRPPCSNEGQSQTNGKYIAQAPFLFHIFFIFYFWTPEIH